MSTRMFWIHALTPLHVGTGQGVGFIDLPIMREKTTNWPLVPGSALKGVLADHHEATQEARKNDKLLRIAFGAGGEDHSSSGALVFTDARIICLPVRSLYGTFAWVTSPLALNRLNRDLASAGRASELALPEIPEGKSLLVPNLNASALTDPNKKVFFEDLDFDAAEDREAHKWAEAIAGKVFHGNSPWKVEFHKRFAVLPDDSFDFLCEIGTEVNARVRIHEESKTVAPGALWYEEALPAESILAGIVWCDWVPKNGDVTREELMARFCSGENLLQIGGKATTGKGRVRCVFDRGGQTNA